MNLFEKTSIGTMEVKNHFVRSATYEGKAAEDGSPTPEIEKIYEKLAAGNIGTIITSYTYVADYEKPAPNQLGIYSDELIEKYRGIVEKVHNLGSKIVMQIVHGSSFKQADPENARIIGPSAIAHPDSGIVPEKMTKDDIKNMIKLFADGAERVKKAGFDGVQIHVAHGYQLSQWISPLLNRREDEYGGSPLNRFRIVEEIYYAVRERVGNFPVWMKINSTDEAEGGLDIPDFLEMGKRAAQIGYDCIEVSGNRWRTHSDDERAYYLDAAVSLAEVTDVPVILTGGMREYEMMEKISRDTKVNLFGFSRPLLADPEFIKKLVI